MIWKYAHFRQNLTGSNDCRHHIPLALMTKSTNKVTYQQFVPTLTSSLWNQRFEESVYLMVCVVMVYPGENRDYIGPWMTFCGLPKITVDMSFYVPFLLFRYLDWSQSWMRQIEEVNAIQIYLNYVLRLLVLWHFRLISSFLAYHHFLLKHSSSKLSSLIRV